MNIKALFKLLMLSLLVTIGYSSNNIKSISLKIAKTKLNRDTNTSIKVIAKTKDNKQIDITQKVKWLINPKGAVIIDKNTLMAKKDINTTIQAEYKNLTSNKIKLNIYWEVNGHILPPEPDPKVNNATLLGVDVNKNGVRDDVERWIYNKYKDKHPIYIDIAMQAARGYKLVLEKQPKTREEAKSIRGRVDSAIDCEMYYRFDADSVGDRILIEENDDIDSKYFRNLIYFNTDSRKKIYNRYDTLLSGDTYSLLREKEEKQACDFNTSKYDKE